MKYRYKCVYGRYDTDIWLDIGIQSYEAATGATLQSQSLFNNMSLEMFPFLATRRPTTLTTAPLRIFVLCRKFTTTFRGIFSLSRHQEANNTTLNSSKKNICVVQEIYNNIPGDVSLSRHQEANNTTINSSKKNICVVQEIYNNIPGDVSLSRHEETNNTTINNTFNNSNISSNKDIWTSSPSDAKVKINNKRE